MEIEQAIGVTLFESDDFGGWKLPQDGVCPTQRANKVCCGVIEVRKVDMANARNTIFEQSRAEQSRAEQLNVCRLGNLNGFEGGSYAGQVFDANGLAPTLTDMQGGGRQPHIVEVKKLEVEQQIVAMRGRNPEDPSDRTPGVELEQRLEPNTQGICNTVTSVQKDNLVLETALMDAEGIRMVRTEEGKALRKAYESGEIHHGFNEYREPEVREDGVSNTITTVPKDTEIVETRIVAIDEQNMAIREDTFGTLTTDGSSPKHNNRVGELKKIKVRQATKEGFVEVELGGGGRPELPYIGHETRQSNRERSDMPYSDNGEYP